MKKIMLIMITLAFYPNLLQSQNSLMPNDLRIGTHIVFEKDKGSNLKYPIVYEKKELQEKPLFIQIMETALAGKIKAHDPSNPSLYHFKKDEITITEIKNRMGAGNDTITIKDTNTGKIIEKIFSNEVKLEQIKSIYFIDAWNFNAEKFTFTKEIISYSPIRKFYKIDDVKKEKAKFVKVFVLNFENLSVKEIKKSNKRLIHYATVKYEQLVDNFEEYTSKERDNIKSNYSPLENNNAPFLNSYNKDILASTIINKVINGEIQSYDFKTKKKFTPFESKGRLGAGNDTITIQDPKTGKKIEKVFSNSVNSSEIRSYIFTEDWYLDPITLRIVKKVKAIAPVRYFYQETDINKEKLLKRIMFEVKMNE